MVKDVIGNEDHHEWVISSLNNSSSQDFFEFFTDKKLFNRTENNLWEKALPEWKVCDPINISANKGFLESYKDRTITTLSNITYGTWIFKYRFPDGTTGA